MAKTDEAAARAEAVEDQEVTHATKRARYDSLNAKKNHARWLETQTREGSRWLPR